MKKFFILLVCLLVMPWMAQAESVLADCADQFIGGTVDNAPTLFSSSPNQPFDTNKHLCYKNDGVSYFALEYWPKEFAPRWAAYKLTPENYGEHGCATFTRKIADCYFQEKTWAGFEACTKGSDPFHEDTLLPGDKLGSNDYSNTGHDRGHIAPRQAFSWDVCATYDSFTMANMSPQRAFLNQNIWADLEQQVLTWGIDEGPVYVVTGTVFRRFPTERFQVYQAGPLCLNIDVASTDEETHEIHTSSQGQHSEESSAT